VTADGTILVFGGTGRQGGAAARELLRRGRAVRALVRDPQAPAAAALAAEGAVLVPGDLEDEASLRAAMSGVAGVFSVQAFRVPGGVEAEERHGKAVADAAAEAGVTHFVYTSVGGADRSSGIPHFESKWNVEQHIAKLGLPATILRPVMFADVFRDVGPRRLDGQLTLGLWIRPEVSVQVIAPSDIGAFAADAFADPQSWIGRELEIAGDDLTGPQMAETFGRVAGEPVRYAQLPIDKLRAVREDLAAMFDWLDREGYQASLPELRRLRPNLVTLEDWLRDNWTAPPA
jgi:uncharacterized protein YbjT (DUF2867 family)